MSVDDETYRRTCAKAAEAGTDVDELVRAYLCEYAETPDERDARLKARMQAFWDKLDATEGGLDSRENLSREELYDRSSAIGVDRGETPGEASRR